MEIVVAAAGVIGALVGGLVAGAFTLRGVRAAGRDARLLATEEAERRGQDATANRVREWQLAALAETREVLVAHLTWLERRVLTDPDTERPALDIDIDDRTRSNINLVGDFAAIKAYTDVMIELSDRLPMTRGEARRRGPTTLADLDLPMIDRTTKVRAQLLKALDEQELRALRGTSLVELTLDELQALQGPEILLQAVRDRQSSDGPHDEASGR